MIDLVAFRDLFEDLIAAEREIVDEVRRGQEPLELTDDRDHSRGETIFVFPHHITGIQRTDNTTWIQVTGNRDYFVQETPVQIASMLRRGGRPLS